jgi:hypothetical protein
VDRRAELAALDPHEPLLVGVPRRRRVEHDAAADGRPLAEDDAVAAAIVRRLVDEVAAFVRVAAARLELETEAVEVVLGGGLLQHAAPELIAEISAHVHATMPHAFVHPTAVSAIVGSALLALDELGLQLIEQPLAPDALLAHAELAQRLRTPIALDETITSAAVARDAIALGACDAVVVKPARIGVSGARDVHDACVAAGVPAVIGGMLETGIGRAVLVAVAALPGFTLTGDCSASDRYFGSDGDLTEPFVLADGCLRVPDGTGLGVDVVDEQLARYTVARERITA